LSCFLFSSRRRHTRFSRDWSSDVCSSDLAVIEIKKNKPRLLYVDSVKTDTKFNDAQRYNYIEAFAVKAIHEYGPFDTVCREKYRSEERRVGKEGRSRWSTHHEDRQQQDKW